ncbi:response regulator [Rhodoferax sp. 4810]|uniref:Response regulator n=1 Tax=Thiospirillum jenense TaxID=1653858 RepID=A0A839HD66_9GAMM|nr:response regulator [Thiospirillum jenense]MBB1074341.1 response regulator [Rhodoferax jenense]MBB1126454.1 response regulator [Thiospirillum jenense]
MTTKRILVIDDDSAVRRAFSLALRASPYQVCTVATGEEGVALVAQETFDLIYLDLRMPEMDGVETLRRIRAINPDVLVYIVTAFHREFFEDLVQARHQGLSFELLRKPLERQQIIEITQAVLSGHTPLSAA